MMLYPQLNLKTNNNSHCCTAALEPSTPSTKFKDLASAQIRTKSPILSHHKFLMGRLDDSRQSNICSVREQHLLTPAWPWPTSSAARLPVWGSGGEAAGRGSFTSSVYPGGGRPLVLLFFFFPPNVPGRKNVSLGSGRWNFSHPNGWQFPAI